MIISPLLEKTRLINKILQKDTGKYVDFFEIASVLRDVIKANVYIANWHGAILGYGLANEFECEIMINQVLNKGYFPGSYNGFLLKSNELRYNLQQKRNECPFMEGKNCLFVEKTVTIIPVISGGERLGTMLLARFNKTFMEDDLILAEKGATVVGMEILRQKEYILEEEARDKTIVKLALNSLTYSELKLVEQVFKHINNDNGLLVITKIAEQLGVAHSVVLNAIRKLESAGVIHAHSLGKKGSYIEVLNSHLFRYLNQKQDNGSVHFIFSMQQNTKNLT